MPTHTPPKLTVPVGNRDHVQGSSDAAVTLVEYGDFECPHCRQVKPIVRELQARFGDRMRYVYRHFPITSQHPNAQLAAEAAEAAGAQGKFWEMHDLLFEHQGEINEQQLYRFAAELDLDQERFASDLAGNIYAKPVREDFLSGVRSGVNGTPTFYLNGERYDGAWDLDSLITEIEKPLGVQVRYLFRQFTRLQASSGIILILLTAIALMWANSGWADAYFDLWKTYLTITLGDLSLSENLLHWVNDGLMVIFFFVVGLEIKREILAGELASLRKAALPLMAAIGGMVLPAAIYVVFNTDGEGTSGWGIPMATDIAFLLALLTVLGSRVPVALKVFFTALAIVDDLGAVLVIALFYSGKIELAALVAAAIILLALIILNWGHVRSPLSYALLGIALWLAFLQSGMHPTIAGVLLAMTIPARTQFRAAAFMAQCTSALSGLQPGAQRAGESRQQQAAAQTLEVIAERIQSPLQRLERNLNPWVAYFIVPVFAFANAGVTIRGNLIDALTDSVSVGILLGLVLGKPLGIMLFSWIAVKTRIADLPFGVTWRSLFATSWLAGIGFTMSLFIATAAFDDVLLSTAKIGILVASAVAALVGSVLVTLFCSSQEAVSELETGGAQDADAAQASA